MANLHLLRTRLEHSRIDFAPKKTVFNVTFLVYTGQKCVRNCIRYSQLILEVTKPQFHHEILTFLIIFSHQSYAIDGSGKYIKFY